MSKRDRIQHLLAVLDAADLDGMGGACGGAALAIQATLLPKGKLVAAVNAPHYHQGRLLGHIAVQDRAGRFWDAAGFYPPDADDLEDFREWGMLDPDDPDFFLDGWPLGERAHEVLIVTLTPADIEAHLPGSSILAQRMIRDLTLAQQHIIAQERARERK